MKIIYETLAEEIVSTLSDMGTVDDPVTPSRLQILACSSSGYVKGSYVDALMNGVRGKGVRIKTENYNFLIMFGPSVIGREPTSFEKTIFDIYKNGNDYYCDYSDKVMEIYKTEKTLVLETLEYREVEINDLIDLL
jgi:hypothetical protein